VTDAGADALLMGAVALLRWSGKNSCFLGADALLAAAVAASDERMLARTAGWTLMSC